MDKATSFAKSLFFPMASYPKPSGPGAISCAIDIAEKLNAHLTAVAFGLDVRFPVGIYADLSGFGEFIVEEHEHCTSNAKAAIKEFQEQVRRRAIQHVARLSVPGGIAGTHPVVIETWHPSVIRADRRQGGIDRSSTDR
jgi:hypothetical protein